MVNFMRLDSVEDKLAHLESLNSIPSINPRVYDEESEYQRLDFIEHPELGIGFVTEVIGKTEFKAFFSKGQEVLQQRSFLNRSN